MGHPLGYYEFSGGFRAEPVIDEQGRIFVGSTDGLVYALDQQGKVLWTWDTGAPIWTAGVVADNGLLYVGNEAHQIFALRRDEGLPQWVWQAPGRFSFESPAYKDGVLYFATGPLVVALQVEDGNLAKSSWPKSGKDNQNRRNAGFESDVPQPYLLQAAP